MIKTLAIFGALLAALAVGFVLINSQNRDTTQEESIPEISDQPTQGATEEVSDDEQIIASPDENGLVEIETDTYSFSPDIIEVKAGETITIRLVNIKGEHDLVIEELGVHTHHVVSPGDTTEVTFTIPESPTGNSYEYYCDVANHRELGQVGTLIVK